MNATQSQSPTKTCRCKTFFKFFLLLLFFVVMVLCFLVYRTMTATDNDMPLTSQEISDEHGVSILQPQQKTGTTVDFRDRILSDEQPIESLVPAESLPSFDGQPSQQPSLDPTGRQDRTVDSLF